MRRTNQILQVSYLSPFDSSAFCFVGQHYRRAIEIDSLCHRRPDCTQCLQERRTRWSQPLQAPCLTLLLAVLVVLVVLVVSSISLLRQVKPPQPYPGNLAGCFLYTYFLMSPRNSISKNILHTGRPRSHPSQQPQRHQQSFELDQWRTQSFSWLYREC